MGAYINVTNNNSIFAYARAYTHARTRAHTNALSIYLPVMSKVDIPPSPEFTRLT